ncbi:MAG TPA: class I SAM-dependent methyltransferase [Bryobacteraceae bacterium]|nr:class I SAM-dependent methyltransferase [Bryobacteraceae bacterium]
MAPGTNNEAIKTEELAALVREIRERVRARYPTVANGASPMPLADLTPLARARDRAEAKVAAIGSVNPRPGGPVNAMIQAAKRAISRGLGWFVRDQIVFNRETMACIEAIIEALNEVNRVCAVQAGAIQQLEAEAQQMKDTRSHWAAWRTDWEHKLALNEMQFLRSVADLQTAFQYRVTLMETNFREMMKAQHADYLGALDRATLDIQKKLWADLDRVRTEYEALIHNELRIVRQRAAHVMPGVSAAPAPAAAPTAPAFDYGRFAERFRGSEEYVKAGQKFYLPYFAGLKEVLDIGCGRGEFLELMREAGVGARGIDLSQESVAQCRQKGLQAEVADLFVYLDGLADASLDGIFSAQVVEHLPPERIPEMIRLASQKLARGGLMAIETPNPECLAIFATHFYLDPTHTRPIPHALLAFYLEECGIGRIEVQYRSPAVESMPALAGLPEDFQNAFFGGLDYAVIGRKLV